MVRLKLIDEKTKSKSFNHFSFYFKKISLFFIIPLFIIVVLAIYTSKEFAEFLYYLFLLLLGNTFYLLKKKYFIKIGKKKPVTEIGFVEIRENEIVFIYNKNKRKYLLDDLTKLKIYSDNYAGYIFDGNVSSGVIFVKFDSLNSKTMHFSSIIENKEEYISLIPTIKDWYINKKHIEIKEYSSVIDDRKLLLKDIPGYEDLQVLKKELGIKKIY